MTFSYGGGTSGDDDGTSFFWWTLVYCRKVPSILFTTTIPDVEILGRKKGEKEVLISFLYNHTPTFSDSYITVISGELRS